MKRSLVITLAMLALGGRAHALDPRLAKVNDFLYVLQLDKGVTPQTIAATTFDLVVTDYSNDGSDPGALTPAEVALMKDSGKVVLAYLSVGEADSFRYYWNPAWNDQPYPDPDAPAWLGPANPDWPDDYKVRYWDPAWQAILFGAPSGPNKSYLDRILDQGFDGVYLDIIDAFDYWSVDVPERTRLQARSDMISLVIAIRQYARETRGIASFLVFPQNAESIVYDNNDHLDNLGRTYLQDIDGVGAEDVFYNELTLQPSDETQYRTDLLDLYRSGEGQTRLVLSIDYVWQKSQPASPANIARYNDYESKALAHGYVPYAGQRDRNLDEIIEIEKAGGIQYAQPKPASSSAVSWREMK
ncbi:MAG: endo alpha-1,4 polygalactosaminidase [Candidatus Sumerlaeota bacterium]|nr:endo alpha-1,4 polygalactosaminidase [Candidatus Sumerlaeota bacterium]